MNNRYFRAKNGGRNNWIASFLVLFSVLAFAQVQAKSFSLAHQFDGNTLTIQNGDETVTLSSTHRNAIAVNYQVKGQKVTPSQALPDKAPLLATSMSEQQGSLVLVSGELEARVQAKPFRIAYYFAGELLVAEEQGLINYDTIKGFRFQLDDTEQLYGGGQRVLGMDRRGNRMPLYNRAHYGYTTESSQMYYGLPAIMSSKNYAILFDNGASGHLDIGASQKDILQFEAVGGRTAYIVTAGDSLQNVIETTVQTTGLQPLPPRWALGNFASRFGYKTQAETQSVVAAYREANIPLDAIVLDLFWFGPDVKGHMGNLNWDTNTFPNPEKMVAEFAEQNIQTILITEPFILTTSSEYEDAKAQGALAKDFAGEPKLFDFYFGNTGLVDIFNDTGRDWFWQYYAKLVKQGVRGWWGDLGEPEVHPADALHNWNDQWVTGDEVHNIYGHQWAKMVYQNTLALTPDERPFLLMRAGFLGSQRYGMIPWTGDVSRSWGGLQPQVELALQMSAFGLAYTHSDLGGFAGGEVFDPELYLRWLQMGAFSPVFRPHAQGDIAPEPIYHQPWVKSLARDIIDMRYQMLPYNYSLVYQNAMQGTPLMRPVAFIDDSPGWFNNKDSYLWGPNLFVQPVVTPNQITTEVNLPKGNWFDFYTGEHFTGEQTITKDLDISHIPVFAKAGSMIPLSPVIQNTQDYTGQSLVVHVYLDSDHPTASFTLYEDSGDNPNALAESQYAELTFTAKADKALSVSLSSTGHYENMPSAREITWVIHGLDHVLAGQASTTDLALTQQGIQSLHWDASTQTLNLVSNFTQGNAFNKAIDLSSLKD